MLAVTRHSWPRIDDGFHDDRQDLARHRGRLSRLVDLLEQHHEFVAAETRDDVRCAQALPQPCADLAQQHVAGLVAQRVVDDLEPVEVDEQHGELAAVPPRRLDRQPEQLR